MLRYNNKSSFLFIIAITLVSFFSCSRDPADPPPPPPPAANAPTIINFTPASGIVGSQVIIDGTNFSASAPGNIVRFNSADAPIISASSTQLTVRVPNNANTGQITVTVNNQTVTSIPPFIVLQPPTITNFAPTNGRPGDQVIISGTNFNLLTATNVVKFNGTAATVSYGTSTQLTVTVPPAATTGPISVTVNGQTATSVSVFTVYNSNVSTFAGGFDHPEGIAKDAAGNMYVANEYDRTIKKITPAGAVSTIATLSNLSSRPMGLAVDASGNIFVADRIVNLIWKVTQTGTVTVFAGRGLQGYTDGPGNLATFNYPHDIAIDGSDNLYVADFGNRVIRKITPAGFVSTFAGSDTSQTLDGIGLGSRFVNPRGISIDGSGNLYVSDFERIRKITPSAAVITIAGSTGAGFADGPVLSAKFNNPKGLAVDASGNIFIADKTRIRKITNDGFVITIAGNGNYGFADGLGSVAEFDFAEGIIIDASGNLFVADASNNKIRKITF